MSRAFDRIDATRRRAASYESPELSFGRQNAGSPETLQAQDVGGARSLLDLSKKVYRARRFREALFGSEHFADPVWDILLDLFIAGEEQRPVSVSSACIAAAVPHSTALRYVGSMMDAGLVVRRPHPLDSRSAYLALTEKAREKMIDYLTVWTASDPAGAIVIPFAPWPRKK